MHDISISHINLSIFPAITTGEIDEFLKIFYVDLHRVIIGTTQNISKLIMNFKSLEPKLSIVLVCICIQHI